MDGQTLKAKACEMAELLFDHHGEEGKRLAMEHFLPDLEQRVRDFYVENGRWPTFRRDPGGSGASIVME